MKDVPQNAVQIGAAERRAVIRVLASGRLVQGEITAAFEDDFSRFINDRGCVAVNSGTSALHLGFLAAGIGPGDEVIVPSFTYAGTVNAVRLAGATPVYCDIDPRTFCVAPECVEALIGPATAAVVAVHLFGQPANMDRLLPIVDKAGVALVEDACQAHGALWRGRPVGSFGRFAAFSFHGTKNMTTGEGGMIVSADRALLDRASLLRNQGATRPYEHQIVGYNNRMTEIAAAIGRVQLRALPRRNARRRRLAERYTTSLSNVRAPYVDPAVEHAFHQYTLRVPEDVSRDGLRDDLRARGVGTGLYYSSPCHRLNPLRAAVNLPETDAAARSVISLPVFPSLQDEDVDRVAAEVDRLVGAAERD